MTESITLSHTVGDHTQSCTLTRPVIKLDDELYAWLKASLVGIGFHAAMVEKFFDGKE